jgi:hypothetical protein
VGMTLSPPNDLQAAIAEALQNPAVRREVAELLTGETEHRARRLAALAGELDGKGLTLKLGSDDVSD